MTPCATYGVAASLRLFSLPAPASHFAACPSRRLRACADEMVSNGCIVETNKANILKPVLLLEKVAGK